MIRGLYTSALGMTVQMKRMDVVTNNIANADTTGFKRDLAVTQSFSDELMNRLHDPSGFVKKHEQKVGDVSLGLFVDDVYTDFAPGSFKGTASPLDLAVSGTGFFNIQVMDKEGNESVKYTRDGGFSLTADGTLMTKEGNKVLGKNGVIVIPPGEITIDENGNVYSNGEYVETLQMTDFQNPQSLRKFGDNLYTTTEETNEMEYKSTIVQGFLENSNISSVREMVEMINVSRIYEANQKVVTMMDTSLGQAVSDIARR